MRDKIAEQLPSRPWALLASVAVLVIGVVVTGFGHWRRGALLMAGALILAATARAILPRRVSGLLVVRRRPLDVLVLGGFGIAIGALALLVPAGPP
ncbi:DUF3017 domain-containing protein [Arachnia propionica]|uniref:DUF3017 domain-containing protein n=1 Tax=Arachnia propionica TaxID=1750 RepID=A0A3P1WYF9_9ACTN|nr:DUF3017 domain-containing protein [Arachnia propionica]RRD50958.1 DUF3017 domain-containing protein [Arachnia propionica]